MKIIYFYLDKGVGLMQVLITGGAGFIGSHVLEELENKTNVDIVVLDNLTGGNRKNIPYGVEFIAGDVRDTRVINHVFAQHQFDAVVHLAAQTMVPYSICNPVRDCQINLGGIINILEASRKYQVPHILFSSSAAVYGDNSNIPLKETEPLKPTSPYGITKMSTEHYIRVYHELYGIDATIFRFANVYGERQGTNGEGGVVSIFCQLLSKGKGVTVFGDGSQTRDFVYAGDIARAIITAFPLKGFHTINISTGEETSLQDLLCCFKKAVGHTFPIYYQDARPGDILRSVLSNKKLRDILHLNPNMKLNQGIQRTYNWFLKQT